MTITLKRRRICFVFIGLLSALSGDLRAADTNAALTIESQLAAIRAQGYPTTMAELDQWRCPAAPGENAATVNREAFVQMVRPSTEVARTLPIDGLARLPEPGMPLSDEMRDTIHDYLKTNSAALVLLHRAALLPAAGYPPEISAALIRAVMSPNKATPPITNNLLMVLMTDLAATRAAARLLDLQAVSATEDQKPAEAVTALGAMGRLTRPLNCQPNVIKHLVEIAIQTMAFSTLERVVNRVPLDDAQLAALADQLHAEEDAHVLQATLIGDRAFILELHKNGGPDKPTAAGDQLPRAWQSDLDEAAFLSGIAAYIKTAALDYPERLPAARRVEEQVAQSNNSFPTAKLTLKGTVGTFVHDAKYTARFRVANAVIAVERERLKTHVLPETLPATALPDPFNGKPLHYKKLPVGYIIYSLGENVLDDGGHGKNDIALTVGR